MKKKRTDMKKKLVEGERWSGEYGNIQGRETYCEMTEILIIMLIIYVKQNLPKKGIR